MSEQDAQRAACAAFEESLRWDTGYPPGWVSQVLRQAHADGFRAGATWQHARRGGEGAAERVAERMDCGHGQSEVEAVVLCGLCFDLAFEELDDLRAARTAAADS